MTLTLTCQYERDVPGPHPGCSEFAPPETITCPRDATRLVLFPTGPVGPEYAVFCAEHADEAVLEEYGRGADVLTGPIPARFVGFCGYEGPDEPAGCGRPLAERVNGFGRLILAHLQIDGHTVPLRHEPELSVTAAELLAEHGIR